MPTLGTGLFPGGGELTASVCRRCGWRGTPIVFEDADAYAAWRREHEALTSAPAPAPVATVPRRRAPKWGLLLMATGALFALVTVASYLTAGARQTLVFPLLVPAALALALVAVGWRLWTGSAAGE